ncbi:MAG: phosphotransferase [Patescibacteria group bacterium]
MIDPLHRIDIALPIGEVVKKTALEFQLGDVLAFSVLSAGYQECNIDLRTASGRFVVKIFSREKTKHRIDDVMWGYSRFHKLGSLLPNPRTMKDGSYVLEIPGGTQPAFLAVFDFFAGKPLTQTPVTDTDIVVVTRAVATIHKSPKTIGRYYDTLAIMNLEAEYEKKSDTLFADEIALIKPVIAKLHKLKISSFRHSVIHGSVEKENVLKNAEGTLCLLDLGCMDYNASVLDIATFIANFSAYLTEEKRNNLIQLILAAYQQSIPLTLPELAALPTLIRAQCAAYIIGMTYHMRKDHDMSKQTQTWLDRGWDGLRAFEKVSRII